MADKELDIEGGTWRLPNPSLMPPAMKHRYLEHLRFLSEDLDTIDRPDPITKETRKVLDFPLRYKKKLINEEELLAVALMGEDGDYQKYLKDGSVPDVYRRFLAVGHVPGEINLVWQVMQRQLQERVRRDSKSS